MTVVHLIAEQSARTQLFLLFQRYEMMYRANNLFHGCVMQSNYILNTKANDRLVYRCCMWVAIHAMAFNCIYFGRKTICIGTNSAAVIASLKTEYKEEQMTLDEAKTLAVQILSKMLDATELTADKVEMATHKYENDHTITNILDKHEVEKLITEYEK